MVREKREKDGLRYLTRERLACWGRRGKERDGVRDEIERKGQFLNGNHGRCTCSSGAPGRTSAVHHPVPCVAALSNIQHVPAFLTTRVEPRSHFDAVT